MVENTSFIAVAVRSGISVYACEELMEKGWAYSEEVGEPGKWIAPIARSQALPENVHYTPPPNKKGLRSVPVVVNDNDNIVVGWLSITDNISDEEVLDSLVSWGFTRLPTGEQLKAMSLVPRLKVQIENDPPAFFRK